MKCQSFGKRQNGLVCFVWFPLLLLIEDFSRNANNFLCLGQEGLAVVAGLKSDRPEFKL